MSPIQANTIKVSREERQQELLQNAKVIWMTGLPGSGKTTNAHLLERKLFSAGFLCKILDNDEMTHGLNSDLSSGIGTENTRRVAEVAKLMVDTGIIVIYSLICPTQTDRDIARAIIGDDDFVEVFIDASFAVCESRNETTSNSISTSFEVPNSPQITINTGEETPEATAQKLFEQIYPLISF